jgi:hypothetical protein
MRIGKLAVGRGRYWNDVRPVQASSVSTRYPRLRGMAVPEVALSLWDCEELLAARAVAVNYKGIRFLMRQLEDGKSMEVERTRFDEDSKSVSGLGTRNSSDCPVREFVNDPDFEVTQSKQGQKVALRTTGSWQALSHDPHCVSLFRSTLDQFSDHLQSNNSA